MSSRLDPVTLEVIRNALGWDWPPDQWITLCSWLLIASTLVSMLDRLRALLRSGN